MIDIGITIDNDGNLGSLRAEGHSMTAGRGANIVCAAVSALLRASVRALDARAGVNTVISADEPGFLELFVESASGDEQWLSGITEMLLAGLLETERDYPGECRIDLREN